MMITPRLTGCTNCVDIASLLEQIDCKIAELGKLEYNKIVFGFNTGCNRPLMRSLLMYKNILTYKYFNCSYLEQFPLSVIASKVKILVAGAKCNCVKKKF
jgi:hypothetical protein